VLSFLFTEIEAYLVLNINELIFYILMTLMMIIKIYFYFLLRSMSEYPSFI